MRDLRTTLLLALIAATGCADQGPVSGPGTLTATLVSPNGPEGAAVVILLGGVGELTAVGETELYGHAGGGGTQIVLIDHDGGDLSFRVAVADTTRLPGFVVQEVAGPDDALRASLSGYDLRFAR